MTKVKINLFKSNSADDWQFDSWVEKVDAKTKAKKVDFNSIKQANGEAK